MSRMALKKDKLRRFSVIWEFHVTGNWVEAHTASRLKIAFNTSFRNFVHHAAYNSTE